jgi:hypothetical protein
MDYSQQCTSVLPPLGGVEDAGVQRDLGVESALLPSWLNRALAYLHSIQSADPRPIPSVIFFTKATKNMSGRQARGGRRAGVHNWTKEETMSMLSLVKDMKPIGDEAWKDVAAEHAKDYPFRSDKYALMRKYGNLHRKPIPTGDPDCPEEVKFAKRIKYLIGNKADCGDADEEFDLRKVKHGESGANPNPDPQANQEPAPSANTSTDSSQPPTEVTGETNNSSTATQASKTPRKRAYRNSNGQESKKENKDDFIEAFRMQMLSNAQNAELDRQMRREEERSRREDHRQFMEMLGTMATAWAGGNTGVSAVFRPGEKPVLEGMESKPPAAKTPRAAKTRAKTRSPASPASTTSSMVSRVSTPSPPSPSSTLSSAQSTPSPSPPKRSRRNARKK